MIFNPYNWSTVVNWTVNSLISLISALLFSFSLLSTEDWDYWQGWMKENTEVATNIKRQDRDNEMLKMKIIKRKKKVADVTTSIESQDPERGSDEVNRQCFNFMRRYPVIKILVTVVLGLWPAGNI